MTKNTDRTRDSLAAFPSTCWTMIRDAQMASAEDRKKFLNVLLSRYWKPIYAFYRIQQKSPDDAAELTQAFLVYCLEKNRILNLERGESRFRSWVKVAARHFMIDQARKQTAARRSPGKSVVSIEALRAEHGDAFEPVMNDDVNAVYEEAWRRQLLENALDAVRKTCGERGRSGDVDLFEAYYCCEEEDRPTWKQIATRFSLESWKHAARRADWVKVKLQEAIRAEIRNYVESDEEIDDELAELLG